MAEKVRPALVVSVAYRRPGAGDDRSPHDQSSRLRVRDSRRGQFLKAWSVPGAKRSDLSERQGDSKAREAEDRSIRAGVRRAAPLVGAQSRVGAIEPGRFRTALPRPLENLADGLHHPRVLAAVAGQLRDGGLEFFPSHDRQDTFDRLQLQQLLTADEE